MKSSIASALNLLFSLYCFSLNQTISLEHIIKNVVLHGILTFWVKHQIFVSCIPMKLSTKFCKFLKLSNPLYVVIPIALSSMFVLTACGGGGGGGSAGGGSTSDGANDNGDSLGDPATSGWTQRLYGADMSIRAVINTGSGYFAVGDPSGSSNYTLKSTDGNSWDVQTVNNLGPLNLIDVVWTGSEYVGSSKGGWFYTSTDGVNWSFPVLPDPNNQVNSVARSGSLIVAVGEESSIYTSTNGTDWSHTDLSVELSSIELNKVEWLNDQFVVVGDSGTVLFSDDGVTWDAQSTGTGDYLIDVDWNGTLYVAASNLNYFTSTDGVNWSSAISTGGLVEDVAWSSTLGLFASVDLNGRIVTSTNGSIWTERISVAEGAALRTIIWGDGQFIAAGDEGEIVTSSDGISWQTLSSSMDLQNILWNGSQFYAVGGFGKVLTSSDGITWIFHRTGDDGDYMYDIADSGTRLLAAAQDYYMSSAADLSWSSRTSIGSTAVDNGVIWDGSQFVSVGDSGGIRVSSDGLSHDYIYSTTTGTSSYLTDVIYTGTLYVVTGYSGTIITSPDLNTWAQPTLETAENLNAVAWSGSVFVAVGNNGSILSSTDGINWTARASGTTNSLYEVIWADSQFVAVGAGSTILMSVDGTTWSVSSTPAYYGTLKGIAYSGSRLVVVGLNGRIISYEE